MDVNVHIKNVLKQQQQFFDTTYNTALIAQGQAEQLTVSFLEQAKIPEEGLNTFKTVITECGKNRDTIKKNIDDNYDRFQALF